MVNVASPRRETLMTDELTPKPLNDALRDGVLGTTAGEWIVTNSAENRLATLNLIKQTQRSLFICSRTLEASIYDDSEIVEAVSRLARRSRFSDIRILVQNTRPIVKTGHRLVELAYQLPSLVHIRTHCEEFRHYNEGFLVADHTGIIYRPNAERFEGIMMFRAGGKAGELVKQFEAIWNKSSPDPNLRRLGL